MTAVQSRRPPAQSSRDDLTALMDQISAAENADNFEAALALCLQALKRAPERIGLRCHAAWLLGGRGRSAEAEKLIRAGLARQPESVSLGRSLAEALGAQERYGEAIEAARTLIWPLRKDTAFRVAYAEWLVRAGEGCDPENRPALTQLAQLWDELHANEKAIEDEWLRQLEAERTRNAPPLPPDAAYVSSLFDCYAEGFDEHAGKLGYCGPKALRTAIDRAMPGQKDLDIVDLGCGTGLAGAAFKPLAQRLTGIDFSGRMILRAQRRGVYDQLIESDAVKALKNFPPSSVDLVIAADMLIYIGDAREVFIQAARVLRPGGCFAATAEKPSDETDGYVLQKTRRYAHSEKYIRRIAAASLFDMLSATPFVMRQEKPVPIDAFTFVMRKKE